MKNEKRIMKNENRIATSYTDELGRGGHLVALSHQSATEIVFGATRHPVN